MWPPQMTQRTRDRLLEATASDPHVTYPYDLLSATANRFSYDGRLMLFGSSARRADNPWTSHYEAMRAVEALIREEFQDVSSRLLEALADRTIEHLPAQHLVDGDLIVVDYRSGQRVFYPDGEDHGPTPNLRYSNDDRRPSVRGLVREARDAMVATHAPETLYGYDEGDDEVRRVVVRLYPEVPPTVPEGAPSLPRDMYREASGGPTILLGYGDEVRVLDRGLRPRYAAQATQANPVTAPCVRTAAVVAGMDTPTSLAETTVVPRLVGSASTTINPPPTHADRTPGVRP
jgi:hypothetical protein